MEKSTLRRADLVFSYILTLISFYIIIRSIILFFNPFNRDFELVTGDVLKQTIMKWYESPALLPLLLGFVLMFLASRLRVVAVKDGAKIDFLTKEKFQGFLKNREVYVATVIIAILVLYVYVLIPQCRAHLNFFPKFQGFPFMIATFISMAIQMITFNKKTTAGILKSVGIAFVAAAAITYGFGTLALIPLP